MKYQYTRLTNPSEYYKNTFKINPSQDLAKIFRA